MHKLIETFLTNHQFYQYREYDKYQKSLEEQIEGSLSKHNQNQVYFEKSWTQADPAKLELEFIAMDLGGMYLRMHHCRIKNNRLTPLKTQKIAFYQNKVYTPETLFGDLKLHLDKFLEKSTPVPKQLVFSFANALRPVFRKKGRLDGEILFWGKKHRQSGLIGLHLGAELEKYLHANGYPELIIDVINDSSLALLSARFTQKSTATTIINLVVGSGTNISVGFDHKNNFKLINLEFGNLDFVPYSNFDHQLNHQSSTPNRFRTEKLFTGAWQNVLFGIILERAVSEGVLEDSEELRQVKNMTSEDLEHFFSEKHTGKPALRAMQFIWSELTDRGAFVCALTLSSILTYLKKNDLTGDGIKIVEVGALLERGKSFRKAMHGHLETLMNKNPKTSGLKPEIVVLPDPTCAGATTLFALCQ